jgi:hypothetical protein
MRALGLAAALFILPSTALASGLDQCEVVVSNEVVDAEGGRMTVASYQSAEPFLSGVFDPKVPLTLEVDGSLIRGIICVRNDLVPTEKDYAVLATGIPLSLSQNFDSADSDILTVYFRDGAFAHKYTSDYPMSSEFKTAVQTRLVDFSARDHGLINPKKNKP